LARCTLLGEGIAFGKVYIVGRGNCVWQGVHFWASAQVNGLKPVKAGKMFR
jgi:hypothetical protein